MAAITATVMCVLRSSLTRDGSAELFLPLGGLFVMARSGLALARNPLLLFRGLGRVLFGLLGVLASEGGVLRRLAFARVDLAIQLLCLHRMRIGFLAVPGGLPREALSLASLRLAPASDRERDRTYKEHRGRDDGDDQDR